MNGFHGNDSHVWIRQEMVPATPASCLERSVSNGLLGLVLFTALPAEVM